MQGQPQAHQLQQAVSGTQQQQQQQLQQQQLQQQQQIQLQQQQQLQQLMQQQASAAGNIVLKMTDTQPMTSGGKLYGIACGSIDLFANTTGIQHRVCEQSDCSDPIITTLISDCGHGSTDAILRMLPVPNFI